MRDSEIDAAVDKCMARLYTKESIRDLIHKSLKEQPSYHVSKDTVPLVAAVASSMAALSSDLLRAVLKELL